MAYVLALATVPGVGPWTAVRCARAYPEYEQLLAASVDALEETIGKRFARSVSRIEFSNWDRALDEAEGIIERHQAAGISISVVDDPDYPPLMAMAKKPAAILYYRGSGAALRGTKSVAVVGTREPTATGAHIARRMADVLAGAGFTIVSGLAKGIDAIGHEAAVAASTPTVAIMGTAIDKVYPAAHKHLADAILAAGGALASEYPMGFPTTGRHFVERDRLQAAASVAVLAVQTGVEGGTMHTVGFAHDFDRPVIVPRPVASDADADANGGIHHLIAERRAVVIESQDDYPDLLDFLGSQRTWLLSGSIGLRPTFRGNTGGPSRGPTTDDGVLDLGLGEAP